MKKLALMFCAFVMVIGGICSAQQVYPYQDCGIAIFEENGKYGLMDERGNILLQPEYSGIEPFVDGLASIERDGAYGLVDTTGNIFESTQWTVLSYNTELGLAKVSIESGDCGVIDRLGNLVVPCEWGYIADVEYQKYIETLDGERRGIYTISGEKIFDAEAEQTRIWEDGTILIQYLDDSAEILFPSGEVYAIETWSDVDQVNPQARTIAVKEEEKIVLKSMDGTRLFEVQADYCERPLGESVVWFRRGELYGFVDAQGEVIIEPEYYRVFPFKNGTAFVATEKNAGYSERYRLIDTQGNFVSERIWDEVRFACSSEAIWGVQDEKYYLVDRKSGEKVCADYWDYGRDYYEGYACVIRDGRSWYIDMQGNALYNDSWHNIREFYKGYAFVKTDEGLWGVIDKQGNYVTEPCFVGIDTGSIYFSVEFTNSRPYIMANHEEVGICYVNEKGEILGPCSEEDWYNYKDW